MTVFLGSLAIALFVISINRGLKMRDDKRHIAELLWYAAALATVAAGFLTWVAMSNAHLSLQRAVLGLLGAGIGACLLVAAGEWLRPNSPPPTESQSNGPNNQSGPITANQGIITQGQKGSNTISK